jgi:hypothetical protein
MGSEFAGLRVESEGINAFALAFEDLAGPKTDRLGVGSNKYKAA